MPYSACKVTYASFDLIVNIKTSILIAFAWILFILLVWQLVLNSFLRTPIYFSKATACTSNTLQIGAKLSIKIAGLSHFIMHHFYIVTLII